ncbi:TPA: hypothetical protein JBF29_04440 [Legionella pneumophila]|nr:hypothetical protein [Legionella pneumophila]
MISTRSEFHKGFQRYPYHCFLTSADLSLGLCSLKSCSYLNDGSWAIHVRKTAGLVMNHRRIQKKMQNLNLRASNQSQKRHQAQKPLMVTQGIRANRCSKKIRSLCYLGNHQNKEIVTPQLKEQENRFPLMPNAVFFFVQGTVHQVSESSLALYSSSPLDFLLFIHCSLIFTFFISIRSQ